MAYLKRLPVDSLKLDCSFIQQLEEDGRDRDLCEGIISLAHKLGLSVIVEDVETGAQRDWLREHHRDIFQGYLFSRPLPATEVTAFLQAPLR